MRRVVDGEDQYGWRWRWPSPGPAFSMWVTNDDPPTPEGITHEIMIWVDRSCDFEPYPNSRVADAEIDGATYTVVVEKEFSTFGQTSSAFARHSDQQVGTLNLDELLAYLETMWHQ